MKLLTNICVNSLTPGLLTLSVSDFGLHWVRLSDYDFLHGMWGPFNQHGWHLILAWIINHRVSKMKFGMPWVTWISNLPLLYYGCDRLSMLIFFKLCIHFSKSGPQAEAIKQTNVWTNVHVWHVCNGLVIFSSNAFGFYFRLATGKKVP